MSEVLNPLQMFFDAGGKPLDDGKIYVGAPNLDPATNQYALFYDAALTIPAAQPLAVSGGYVWRSGSPARIYLAQKTYSIKALTKNDAQVFYIPTYTAESASAESLTYQALGTTRTVSSKLSDSISVKDFGAVGDGVTDDTAAIQAAIDYFVNNPTNPSPLSTRGCGKILFPRGKYKHGTLNIGSAVGSRAWGFVFEGDGEYATSLLYSSNAGTAFNIQKYNGVAFDSLAIIHTDVTNIAANRGTWTNTCFKLDGTGGGRGFCLRNVTTHGFNRLIDITNDAAGNCDTTFITDCTFADGNTFLYARHSNAVVNHIQNCTFGTEWNIVFDLGGWGHSTINNCNIVVSGTILHLENFVDSFQNSRYVFDNCKMEFYAPYGGASNATTKLLNVVDDLVDASIDFRSCTFAGGKTPDPSVYQVDLKNVKLKVDFQRCFLATSMKFNIEETASLNAFTDRCYLRMTDCDSVPPVSNINFGGTGIGSNNRLPVTYLRCTGVNNISLSKYSCSADIAQHNAVFSPTAGSSPTLVLGSTTRTFDYLFYGQNTCIDKAQVLLESKVGLVGCTVTAYSDAGRTVSIGSVAIPDGTSSTAAAYTIPIAANTVLSAGIYLSITNTNAGGAAYGKVSLSYVNF